MKSSSRVGSSAFEKSGRTGGSGSCQPKVYIYTYIYIYIGTWFCRFIQETGEPMPVQSASLETAPSLEPPPQELDVVQYMSCTCVQRIFCIFAAVFGISISSLAVFRPPTIPQHQHQEVAPPVQQSGEMEANEEELYIFCALSPGVCQIFCT